MSFKNDIPDFKSYPDGDLYMQTVPSGVWSSLDSLIRRASSDQYKLKAIINTIAEITGGQLTQNYNWSFLEGDIPQCMSDIKKKTESGRVYRFEAFMDSLAVLANVGDLICDELNEFLEDKGIGYYCERSFSGQDVVWYRLESEGTEAVDSIKETQAAVASISKQAYDRFESALRQFQDINEDERARKDAVRSCVDAMEALIKELGGDDEIGEATKNLKNATDSNGKSLWGPVQMVKDGNALFNLLHELYPDVRHGTQDFVTTDMTMEEAEYFVGRITVFMRYIAARAKKLGYDI